jgi:hypothetical protein
MYLSTVSFQHGELNPEEAHKMKCELYANRRTGERVVRVAVNGDNVFSGSVPAAGSQLAWNLIAIRNKRTNKVRLYPFKHFVISCILMFSRCCGVYSLPGYDTVLFCNLLSMFWRRFLPPSLV